MEQRRGRIHVDRVRSRGLRLRVPRDLLVYRDFKCHELLVLVHRVVKTIAMVTMLLLGTFMDLAPMLLICTPIFMPVIAKFGIDPVHFGMIMILNLGIGLITPPVGPTLFVGCAIGKVTMEEVSKELWPFYGAMCLALLLVTYIPAISLWLPGLTK